MITIAIKKTEKCSFNSAQVTGGLNSGQALIFTYDTTNRLTSASTNATGQGQYSQTNGYNPTTGNLSSKSDVGAYTYSPAHPHAVTQAGSNTYTYDQNGNMTSRTVAGVAWTYAYNAESQLTSVRKNSQLVSEYGYDGDGKRVWAKDYEGYLATNPKVTTYIGNYFEVQVEGYVQPTGGTPSQPCTQTYCAYFPLVANTVTESISYYYADGQRIAMKNNGVVSYLYGDQLGSVSAVTDASGNLVSRTLYQPWGTTRYSQGVTTTDYAYTGQMQEGDIYFYNARWYDPYLGRFMQADTIVPTQQGTQAWDRYAYLNNNPVNGTDPTGHCIDGISTAFCVVAGAMVIGAIGGYVTQVSQNMSAGMSFADALITDISATPILQGAAIAGIGVTAAITGGAALGIGAGTIATVGQGVCADGDCTNEGSAVGNVVSDAYGGLSHAAEYGIKTYKELRALTKGTGLQVHHLIEERLADALELTKSQLKSIPSVVIDPTEHQVFTNLWRSYIVCNGTNVSPNTSTASVDNIRYAVQQIYSRFPELLNASIRFLNNLE